MTDRVSRGLRSLLIVVAVTALVIVARALLDELVGPRGWYVLVFAGVFATARLSGVRAAVAVTLLVAGARLVLPVVLLLGATLDRAVVVDAGLDLLAGAAALAM